MRNLTLLGGSWLPVWLSAPQSSALSSLFCSWIIIFSTVVTIIIVFDPLGGKTAPYSSAGPDHLDSHESSPLLTESSQLLTGLRTAAASVWETRIKLLCCCVGKDDQTRVAFSSTAELLSTCFSVSRRGPVPSVSDQANASDVKTGALCLEPVRQFTESSS